VEDSAVDDDVHGDIMTHTETLSQGQSLSPLSLSLSLSFIRSGDRDVDADTHCALSHMSESCCI